MTETPWEFPPNVVSKENSVTQKNRGLVLSGLAELARQRQKKEPGQEMLPKDFNVWIIQTEASHQTDPSLEDTITLQSALNAKSVSTEILTHVTAIPERELQHMLSATFHGYGEVSANELPDLVVVSGATNYRDTEPESDLSQEYLEWEMKTVRDIRHAVDRTLHLHEAFETGDPIQDGWTHQSLSSDILGAEASRIGYHKQLITPENALAYAVAHTFHTEADWTAAVKAFDTYARTGDRSSLEQAMTPGRIKRAIEWTTKIREKMEIADYRWREKNYGTDGGFRDESDYLAYRQELARTLRHLTEEQDEAAVQDMFRDAFRTLVDAKKAEYLYSVESRAADERLLQPLIVAVGKSQRYQDAAFKAGADAILTDLSTNDMHQLVALAKRIRTNPASLATERLRRNKAEFYQTVVDQIESRSEETADTKKELHILSSLFETVGAKNVLDVGSGYGRLAKPLARSGYTVTGIDANRLLLAKANREKEGLRNLHYRSGDIIDYRKIVAGEAYDAVYYGWHSFLEAYGFGNALATLRSARHALKPGGTLTFDQPARTNPGLEDGWYGDAEHGYLAYLMDESEIRFLLRLAGFEDVHFLHWTTKPSELYPTGMQKITVAAQKPSLPTLNTEAQKIS